MTQRVFLIGWLLSSLLTGPGCASSTLESSRGAPNNGDTNNNNTNNGTSNVDMGTTGGTTGTNNGGDGVFDGKAPMTVVREGNRGFLLHGMLLTPTGIIDGGQVLVIGSDIVCVDVDCTTDPDAGNATWIATGGIISPGLIDAHNHLIYNFLPEWEPPGGATFQNRYQWAEDPDYEAHIAPIAAYRVSSSHVCPATRWGELRSLMHGTTTMQGQSPNQSCAAGGVRNADHDHGLQYDHLRTTISSPRDIDDDMAASFIDSIDDQSEPVTRVAVHMQEGISGNNVLEEFESWAGRDDRTNRHMGTSLLYKETSVLIHSLSLTPAQLDEVAATNSKVVWSPSSNIVLYGGTAPIDAILSRGILTGIGPDWTISGEDEMLSELRYAYDYGTQTGIAALTTQKLWEMATSDGAEVVGLGGFIGRLEVGYRADLVVFANQGGDPFQSVIENRSEDIGLVLINGQAYYGADSVREDVARNTGCETIDICGVQKFVCAREPDITNGQEGVSEIRQRLVDILEGNGYPPEEQYGRGDELLELVDCSR